MTTRRILLRITTISLLMALLAVGGLLAQPTPPPIIVSNNTTTTFTFDDGADPSVWFSGTYAIVPQAEGGYGMAIALDDAPVTLNRPLLDGETLAVTLRRGVGRAGVRLVGETAAYTVWIETSGIAVLERDGAEQGRVTVAGDAQRVALTYTAGTLTASVGAYAFPPISDGTAFASLRAEFVVQGGNGQGSTFDDVTVPLPPGLMNNVAEPTPTATLPAPEFIAISTPGPTPDFNAPQWLSAPSPIRYRLVRAGDEAGLYQAVADVNAGLIDTIYLNSDIPVGTSINTSAARRTYYLTQTIEFTTTHRPVIIHGNHAILRPAASAPLFFPLMKNFQSQLNLFHLHLTGNNVSSLTSYGAGIVNYGSLIIFDSSLTDLMANQGAGAIFNQSGYLALIRTSLLSNGAGGGGAVQNELEGTVVAHCSRFIGNSANYGAAILNGNQHYGTGGIISILYSSVYSNTAPAGTGVNIRNLSANIAIDADYNYWGATNQTLVLGPNISTENALEADPTKPTSGGAYLYPICRPQNPARIPVNTCADGINRCQIAPFGTDTLPTICSYSLPNVVIRSTPNAAGAPVSFPTRTVEILGWTGSAPDQWMAVRYSLINQPGVIYGWISFSSFGLGSEVTPAMLCSPVPVPQVGVGANGLPVASVPTPTPTPTFTPTQSPTLVPTGSLTPTATPTESGTPVNPQSYAYRLSNELGNPDHIWSAEHQATIAAAVDAVGRAFQSKLGTATPQEAFNRVMVSGDAHEFVYFFFANGLSSDVTITYPSDINLPPVTELVNIGGCKTFQSIPRVVVCNWGPATNALFPEQAIVHELGHVFTNRTRVGNSFLLYQAVEDTFDGTCETFITSPFEPILENAGLLPCRTVFDSVTREDLTANQTTLVMGRDRFYVWQRGVRGWGSGPDTDVTMFQQNPPGLLGDANLRSLDESVPAEVRQTILDETTADMFLNWVFRRTTDSNSGISYTLPAQYVDLSLSPGLQNSGTQNAWMGFHNSQWPIGGTAGPDDRLPGNARFLWFDILISAVLAQKGWL